ncbi:MAG: DUF4384 domain-containing protein [Rhodocyclaceae bacterium]|nr:DUF4384 domain-containing protein [Rhodocyclaceae bacterium]MBX3669543.1 DUF4384 domain-containing protein [Rhodocyclaceae bacterium]
MADDTNDDTVHISGFGNAPPLQQAASGGPEQSGDELSNNDPRTLRRGARVGNYQITGVVGKGGFGIVYLARHITLQREVALKEYMPRDLAMRLPDGTISVVDTGAEEDAAGFQLGLKSFINEARLLAGFEHPALAGVMDYWEANGTAYMVMPFYRGRSMRVVLDELKAAGKFPPSEQWLRDTLNPILDALATLHAKGCFHRDVSPENIQVLHDGDRPVLLDFGAARMAIGGARQHMTAFLNPRYAPVEQYYEGQDDPSMLQGPWTDLYALGGVVFFALRGQKPQSSQSRLVMDCFDGLATGLPPGLYSEQFLSAFDKCLAVKPKDRPQSVAELREMLGVSPARPAPGSGLAASTSIPSPQPAQAVGRPSASHPGAVPSAVTSHTLGQSGIGRGLIFAGVAAVLLAFGLVAFLIFSPGPVGKPTEPVPAPVAAAASSASPAPVATSSLPPPVQPETTAPTVPTVPAPVETTAQAAPAPFSAIQAGTSGEFPVDLKVLRHSLKKGVDTLEFSLLSKQTGFLYVYLRDIDGEIVRIFPNEFDSFNELKAGTPLTLPSPDWELKAPPNAGSMELLAVVSAARRSNPAGARRKNGQSAFLGYGKIDNPSADELLGNVNCGVAASCSNKYGSASVKLRVE